MYKHEEVSDKVVDRYLNLAEDSNIMPEEVKKANKSIFGMPQIAKDEYFYNRLMEYAGEGWDLGGIFPVNKATHWLRFYKNMGSKIKVIHRGENILILVKHNY